MAKKMGNLIHRTTTRTQHADAHAPAADPVRKVTTERRLTDAEIEAQIVAAQARSEADWEAGRCAVEARYDPATRTIIVGLSNGGSYTFPVSIAPELDAMSDEQLSRVRTFAYSLAWEAEDVGLCVISLLEDAETFGLGTLTPPPLTEVAPRAGTSTRLTDRSA